jgi:hypothetical protein
MESMDESVTRYQKIKAGREEVERVIKTYEELESNIFQSFVQNAASMQAGDDFEQAEMMKVPCTILTQ